MPHTGPRDIAQCAILYNFHCRRIGVTPMSIFSWAELQQKESCCPQMTVLGSILKVDEVQSAAECVDDEQHSSKQAAVRKIFLARRSQRSTLVLHCYLGHHRGV